MNRQGSHKYTFRPIERSDHGLLSNWLRSTRVAQWYQDPEYADDLVRQSAGSKTRRRFVLLDGIELAFVQDYDIHAWPSHHLAYLPEGSRGIDTFIGKVEMMGKGHGPRYLRELANKLFADGVPALGIDPHPLNLAAQRAYKKVGFVKFRENDSDWGRVLLMHMHAPQIREGEHLATPALKQVAADK